MSILKMVVLIIGIAIILCIFGMIYLVVQEKPIPGTLETVVALGFGGLLGLLAPSKDAANPNN